MRKLVTLCKRYKTFSSFKAYGKRGRHIAFRKRRETYRLLKVREKCVFGRRWKKCGLWKERGKVWSLESAGKNVVFGKRGKKCGLWKAREKCSVRKAQGGMEYLGNARKHMRPVI